jgi:hypothetical protein
MMDRHIGQQRMVQRVMAVPGGRRPIGIAPEVDCHGADGPQAARTDQLAHRLHRREEAIVLTDHEHAPARRGDLDHLPRLGQRRSKGLFEQHMFAGLERLDGERHMARQTGRDQHRLGIGRRQRRGKTIEVTIRREVQVPARQF